MRLSKEQRVFIHVSSTSNRASIETHGLMPSLVKLKHHRDGFKQDGTITKDNKSLYGWEDSEQNERWIRDLMFCKWWLHPRNNLVGKLGEKDSFFKLLDRHLYPLDCEQFDIWEAKTKLPNVRYIHEQACRGDPENSAFMMPPEFSHDSKEMVVLPFGIKVVRRIGLAEIAYRKGRYTAKVFASKD